MMKHYFEVADGDSVVAFEDLDEAIAYADEHSLEYISEIGGSWVDYHRCAFCNHWFDACHLDTEDDCPTCHMIILQQLRSRE